MKYVTKSESHSDDLQAEVLIVDLQERQAEGEAAVTSASRSGIFCT